MMKRAEFRKISLGIRLKITALNGVFLLLLALSLVYIMRETGQATVAIEKQRESLSRLEQVSTAAQQFIALRYWLTDLSLSWLNESESQAEEMQKQLETSLSALEATDKELVTAVRPEVAAYVDLMTQSVDTYVDGNRVQGNALVAEARNRAKVVDENLSELLASAGASTREAGEVVITANARVKKIAIGFLVVGITFGGLLSWLFGRSIAKPLVRAVEGVKRLAAGDLSQQVAVRSRDEIGQIGEALNQAVEGMRTALQTDRVDWQEVGKQRQREKESMAEMAKKQAMIENTVSNIMLADRDLNITYINPATAKNLEPFAHLLPVPLDQVVGSNIDVFHKNPTKVREILSDPNNLPHRAVIELGDQKMDLLVTAVRDGSGEYLGTMVTWENITEKLAAEEREKLQAGQIKERAESLQDTTDQLLAEIGGLVEAAREGRLSVRANADLFEGGFADLVRGVNETVDSILTPVNEAATTLEKIAQQDLTARMAGDYQGDHAALKDNLNKAVENLDRVLSQVALTVGQVGSSSSEIATGSQTLAQGAQEQASSLEEISSSLEQMSSMTKQNADNSNQAKLLSGEAQSSAENGNEAMRQMTEAIDKIKASSDQTAKIVKTIDEIAFQTNLLALNAAVEAARAGEAGKGFAVVAEEVRNLAQRSAEAARNTTDMIEESVKNAEGGVRITEEVAKVLAEIGEGSRKVNDLVAEIAAASNEQSLGIEQVNTAVSELDRVTQQNAANSEESSSTAQSLNGRAGELGNLVGTFQLNQQAREARPDVAARSLAQEVGQAAGAQPLKQQLEPVAVGSSHAGNGHGKSVDKVIPLDEEDFGDF